MIVNNDPMFNARSFVAMTEIGLNGLIYIHEGNLATKEKDWRVGMLLEAADVLKQNSSDFIPIVQGSFDDKRGKTNTDLSLMEYLGI